MNYEKLWRSLKKFSGHQIVLAETHVDSDSTIKNMMVALEVHEEVAQKKKAEAAPSTSTNKTHEEICEYIYDEDSDTWDSKCGYNIEDEHTCRRAKFCQYCGRKLHHA